MNHLIIDGLGLGFKSMYAFLTLTTKDGRPSGIIYGYLCGLRSLKKKYPSFHFTVAWDNEAKRKKGIYPEYKSERPKQLAIPDESITDLKALFSAMNIDQAEAPDEEGDDVIASIVKKYSSEDGLIYVYSSDKDMLQLIKDGKVIVIRPQTGGIPDKIYDSEAVRQKYGVSPQDFACYQAFRGDSIDSVPGVPRVPSKVIAFLVNQYKSLEAVYSSGAINTLTEFQKTSFLSHVAQSHINLKLVKLRDDLSMEITEGATDKVKVEAILSKYEIRSMSANSLADMFETKSSFLERQAPAIESYSLF